MPVSPKESKRVVDHVKGLQDQIVVLRDELETMCLEKAAMQDVT